MTPKWTRVALKGKAQIIPPLCPNCLGDGTLKYRYGYKGLQGWLMRGTLQQFLDPASEGWLVFLGLFTIAFVLWAAFRAILVVGTP